MSLHKIYKHFEQNFSLLQNRDVNNCLKILLQGFLWVTNVKCSENSRCFGSGSLERDSEMENSTQEVHYGVLSEWQLRRTEGSRTEQREKVGYQAVATETANSTGSGSGLAWSYSILSTGARERGLQSPIATVIGCKLPKRRGRNLQRDKSLQQQLCSVIGSCWSWGKAVSPGSGQPSVPPPAGNKSLWS